MAIALLFLAFTLLLAIGVPVAYALAVATLATLLYVDLPPLGGVELCRAMRATRQYAAIPVMFQSSYAEPETIRRVFEAGADDYLVKPASGLELLTRVGNRLERFRQIASAPLATPGQGPLHTSLDQMFLRAARDNLAVSLACVQVPENGLGEAQQKLRNSLRNEDVVRTLGPAELVVGMLGVERDRAVERLRGILDGTVALGVAEFPADARDYAGLVQQARERRG